MDTSAGIVEDQFTALSKVLSPMTVTEQDSEVPGAMGVTHVGTTKETLDGGVASEFGAIVALTPQPAGGIAKSKVVLVLLIREAFPIFKLPNQFAEERLLSSTSHAIPIFEDRR
jgi:hypothetical protein